MTSNTLNPALAATPLTPTPLAAALSQSGIPLPIPYLDLSAPVMGRTFVRAALNSARNIHPGDNSPQAQAARRISGFGDLEGLEFVARFDIEKDGRG